MKTPKLQKKSVTNSINKRLHQLNKFTDDELIKQIFKCEVVMWSKLCAPTIELTYLPLNELNSINSFYSRLEETSLRVKTIESNVKNSL